MIAGSEKGFGVCAQCIAKARRRMHAVHSRSRRAHWNIADVSGNVRDGQKPAMRMKIPLHELISRATPCQSVLNPLILITDDREVPDEGVKHRMQAILKIAMIDRGDCGI